MAKSARIHRFFYRNSGFPGVVLLTFTFYILQVDVKKPGIPSFSNTYDTHPVSPPTFTFSPLALDIYLKILSLRFGEALQGLQTLRKQEPHNLLGPFLENYLDFFYILITDDHAFYRQKRKYKNLRLAQLARGDRHSPYYLYTQAEIRLQWAVLQLRYGDYLNGLREVKKGYNLLTENQRRHPGFAANAKSLGILHALLGNIPGEYQWVIGVLAGMRGTVQQGLEELASAVAHESPFSAETRTAYAFLLLHLKNDQTKAWQQLTTGLPDPRENPLAAYAMASMAIRLGRNDEAIRLLRECPDAPSYHPFPYRHYLLGIAKLHRLDSDANQPLETFIQTTKGENGLKEAFQKLAWHQLISGNENGYRHFMQLAKTKGSDRSEPDKAALQEARSREIPDIRLLKARLLFDGGYYERAFALLKNAAGAYTGPGKNAVEYAYRMGRIEHASGHWQSAAGYYAQTIGAGADQPWHFACNAALQMGLLYEQQGDFDRARSAFRRCLQLHPETYAATLHARAKAGLERLHGR